MQFPVFIELDGRTCLVVGGGDVAARKATTLAEFGADVVVVAPRVSEVLRTETFDVRERRFEPSDLDGVSLVVAATDDAATNARVSRLCREKGIPVNVADDPEHCTFTFGALFRKGSIIAAVSSGGTCPVAAQMVRDRLAKGVSDGFAEDAARLGAAREELKRRFPDPADRKAFYKRELEKWND